jgi:uncharacterized protein (TIGR02186 family)
MMKKFFLTFLFLIFSQNIFASPIISGISTNEINIDTKFQGAKILLFGAKGDAGNIVIAVRGPKKNFFVTKKEKFLGIWYNGERLKFKDTYSYYSLFSTSSGQDDIDELLIDLELGRNNLQFQVSGKEEETKKNQFQIQLIDRLEKNGLYSSGAHSVDFLDETLFKVMLEFPKNISRGVYTVEIYLISEGALVSFQSIPIRVNQVGFSAQILDFAYNESFLYGLLVVAVALVVGWLANYLFVRFVGK